MQLMRDENMCQHLLLATCSGSGHQLDAGFLEGTAQSPKPSAKEEQGGAPPHAGFHAEVKIFMKPKSTLLPFQSFTETVVHLPLIPPSTCLNELHARPNKLEKKGTPLSTAKKSTYARTATAKQPRFTYLQNRTAGSWQSKKGGNPQTCTCMVRRGPTLHDNSAHDMMDTKSEEAG